MSVNSLDEYWVPEHVKEYLRRLGFVLPLDDMEPWIRSWDDWMGARGDFYDYRDTDGFGRIYEVHRRSIHPAMRVCQEWGSLLLNDKTEVVTEVDVSKMRIFLSDVMFDKETDGKGRRVSIPFGRQDCTVFRKVMSTEDLVQDFAPALRTDAQAEAFRIALQMLGDLCGFGLSYFDFSDSRGFVKTATEVSSDNSALMRNIARHEHVLEGSLAGISHALLHMGRGFGDALPDEGEVRVQYDDSIITDTYAEKEQDMKEVGVTMAIWEYRQK